MQTRYSLICWSVLVSLYYPPLQASEPGHWLADLTLESGNTELQKQNGTLSTPQENIARVGLGYDALLNERWRFVSHVAGRYSSIAGSSASRQGFLSALSTENGLNAGDATLDSLYFSYKRVEDKEIQLGRMQLKVTLPGVNRKSLSRNDSVGTQITWTDGMRFAFKDVKGWQNQAVFAYSSAEGSSTVQRAPLSLNTDSTRWSAFFAGDKVVEDATWFLKGFTFTYLPTALCRDGVSTCANRVDYPVLVAREGWQWHMGEAVKIQFGLEAGLAVSTPPLSVLNLPGSGDAGGSAWQLSLDLMNFAAGQSTGVVIGRAEAGWLISPDFRNNSSSTEWRYHWQISSLHAVTAGWLSEEDILQPLSAVQKQRETRTYLRYEFSY